MAGQTITVSVLADTKHFGKAMKGLGDELGLDKLGGAAKKAGKAIAVGLGAVAAGGVAVLGTALKKGFDRLNNIDQATAKLRGLGHSAQTVAGIMDNALGAVKGTAYGLDEAATTAAGAVAAGIKPGQELERILSLTADTATIAGSSMGEMGSIFNKVAASNRLSMAEVNQLADRGVPIMQMLAEQYGVTSGEARKMVEEGKVGFADFATALEKNIGGAALESGKTVSGAWANMQAALGRVGAQLLSGIFPQLVGGFGSITEAIDDLGPTAEKVGQWLGEKIGQGAKALGDWIDGTALPALRSLGDWFTNTGAPALQDFSDKVGDSVVPALDDLANWFRENEGTIVAATTGIATFIATLMGIQKVIAIAGAVKAVVAGIAALLTPVGLVIGAIAALTAAAVVFFTQTEVGRELWAKIWPAIQEGAAGLAAWFTGSFVPMLQTAWEQIKVAAAEAGTWMAEHIGPVLSAAGEVAVAVAGEIAEAFESLKAVLGTIDWAGLWEGLSPAFAAAWDGVVAAAEGGLAVLAGVLSAGASAIEGDWASAFSTLSGTLDAALSASEQVADARSRAIAAVMATVMNSVQSAWNAAWSAVQQAVAFYLAIVVTIVRAKIDDAVHVVSTLPTRALAALGEVGTVLFNAGAKLIGGFISGMRSKFPEVTGALQTLTALIPLHKGPPAKDRVLLRGAGQLIIQGLVDGMESRYGAARASLAGLTDTLTATMAPPATATIAAPAARSTPPAIYVQNPFTGEYLLAQVTTVADQRVEVGLVDMVRAAR